MKQTLVLMGHGSRDPEGVHEFLALARAVQAAAPDRNVRVGMLEFPSAVAPSIQDALDACAAEGTGEVRAVPILLCDAGHAKADMPAQVAQGRRRHPELKITACPPLGIHQGLLEITEERIHQVAARCGSPATEDTAVLLVGRGTSDPEANGDFLKTGRLLWERNHYPIVECAFVSLALPDVSTGFERCVRLGARTVLVVPYFINTGVLVKRIAQQSDAAAHRFPDVRIAVGEHMGVHPKLVRLILQRAEETAQAGTSILSTTHQHTHHHAHEDETGADDGPLILTQASLQWLRRIARPSSSATRYRQPRSRP